MKGNAVGKNALLLALLAGFVLSLHCGPTMAVGQAMVGHEAPDFTLSDVAGKAHTLKSFKGKYVILEWVNFGCPFVKKHYSSGNMQALQREVSAKGVVWLSVNSSAPGKQGFYKTEELSAILHERDAMPAAYLLDTDGTVGKLYGARTTPHMYVVDPNGKLIYMGAIDDKPTTDKNDIPGARNYVRQAIAEGMAGKAISEPSTSSYGCSVKYQ